MDEKKDFDMISVGDATIDHFVMFHDANVNCEIKPETCQLCMNYADKLPVDQYISLVAGNAANNAVGSARLGLKTAIYLVLGDDEGGRRIKNQLNKEGVDTSYVDLRSNQETNSSFVLSFQGERTILVYHVPRTYSLPDMSSTKWLYLTSTGHGYEALFNQVLDFVKKNGVKMGYNPGTFQLRGDSALMAKVLKSSEVVFINVEEAQQILGAKDRDVKKLLAGMKETGPGISVITDAHAGAYAFDGEKYFHIEEFSPDRVETTGAGDAFATGFLGALNYDLPIDQALRWASVNANSVVQKIGPQAGLLTKAVIEQRLAANSDYVATEI